MLNWTPGTSGLMIRRAVFGSIGVFDSKSGSADDLEFTMRFAEAGRWKIHVEPQVLVEYYTHGTNLSSVVSPVHYKALTHIYVNHRAHLRRYPGYHDRFWYRVARIGYVSRHASARELAQEFGLSWWHLKFWAAVLVERVGAMGIWRAAGRARLRRDEAKRLERFKTMSA
jgi:GT2 family glycosyltransferase